MKHLKWLALGVGAIGVGLGYVFHDEIEEAVDKVLDKVYDIADGCCGCCDDFEYEDDWEEDDDWFDEDLDEEDGKKEESALEPVKEETKPEDSDRRYVVLD